MATTPDLQEPQIAAARAAAWHQKGEPLLTLEAARTFLNEAGLLLFAPRGTALGTPAPSLVEATLGTSKDSTSPQEADTARTLVARLVGEGSAVPLNLLGGAGDVPDFLVSTQAFPFVFTLRGDKGWKRAPETSGAIKVTPLGLRVYELLVEKGAMTVAEIVPEIGREVTESAVARALNELWQILRVIPVLQQGEGETRWELLTTRYMKAVKAGANAGQPTALSALVSHFLEQVYVASEEEIAAFLSPLTARSRVREVLHGLVAGRQLTEGVLHGKAVLYLPDALPDFAAFAQNKADDAELGGEATDADQEKEASEPTEEGAEATGRQRIQRFERGSGPDRTLRGKPFRRDDKSAGPGRAAGRSEGGRAPRPGYGRTDSSRAPGFRSGSGRPESGERSGTPDRERRPFGSKPPRREGQGSDTFPRRRPVDRDRGEFAKPWDDERGSRPPRTQGATDRPPRAPRRDNEDRPPFRKGGPRPPRREGSGSEDRPFAARREGSDRPPRRFGGDRPTPRRREGDEGGAENTSFRDSRPQRPFRERAGGEDRPSRPFRPSGDQASRPRGDRPFRPAGDRPFRTGGDRPYRPAGDRPSRPNGDRPFRPRSDRPFPAEGDSRPGGDRPSRPSGDRPFRPAGDRPFRSSGDRPFRPSGDRPFRPSGDRPFRPSGDRPFRPAGDRPARGGEGRPQRPGGDRPQGRSGGRPSFGGAGGGGRFQGRPGAGPGGRGKGPGGGGGRPDRPSRAPRKPRPEDEA